MNEDRLAGWLEHRRVHQAREEGLRGFVTNPLGEFVSQAHALIYEAAYLQAKKDLEEPEWPWAEYWN